MCDPKQELNNAFKGASNFVSNLGKGIENVGKGLENTLNAIAKNPLPTLEAAALTYALGPEGAALANSTTAAAIASTAVQYANGNHNINSLLLNIGASVGGSMIGEYAGAQTGEFLGTATENELTGQVTPSLSGLSNATNKLITQVVTSASGQAATVALKGGNLQQVLTAGVSGAVSASVNAELKSAGIQNAPAQVVANATAAATRAILGGTDISTAIGSSIAATAIQQTISAGVNSITNHQNNLSNLGSQYYQTASDFKNWVSTNLTPLENTLNTGATIQANAQVLETQINQFDAGAAIINGQTSATTDALAAAGIQQTGIVKQWQGPAMERELIYVPQYTLPDGAIMTGYNVTELTNYLSNQVQPLKDQSNTITQNIADYNTAYSQYQALMPTYNSYQNQLSSIQTSINNEQSGLNTDIQNVSNGVAQYEQQITQDAAGITKQITSEAASAAPSALDSAAQTQGFTNFAQLQTAQSQGFDPTNGAIYQSASRLGYTDPNTYAASQQVEPGITASQYNNLQSYASNAGFSNLSTALQSQNEGFTNIGDYQTAQQLNLSSNDQLQSLKIYSANAGFSNDLSTALNAQNNGFSNADQYNTAKSLDLTNATQLTNLENYSNNAGFGSDLSTAQTAQIKGFDTATNYDTAVGLGLSNFSQLQNLKDYASNAGFDTSTQLSTAQTAQNNGFETQKDYNTALDLKLTTNAELNSLQDYASNAGFKSDLATAQIAQNEGFDSAKTYNTAIQEGFDNNKTYQLANNLGITTAQGLNNLQDYASKGGFSTDLSGLQTAQTAQGLNLENINQLQDLQNYASNGGFNNLSIAQQAQNNGFENNVDYTTAKNLNINTYTQLQDLETYASNAGFKSDLATAQVAQNAGFTDASTYNTATSYGIDTQQKWTTVNTQAQDKGWTGYVQQETATTSGFKDSGTYNAAQQYNIPTQSAWNTVNTEAQKSGWNNYSQEQLAKAGGFTDPTNYTEAAQNGFTNAKDWTAANAASQQAGWPDYSTQKSANNLGFTQPSEIALSMVQMEKAFSAEQPSSGPGVKVAGDVFVDVAGVPIQAENASILKFNPSNLPPNYRLATSNEINTIDELAHQNGLNFSATTLPNGQMAFIIPTGWTESDGFPLQPITPGDSSNNAVIPNIKANESEYGIFDGQAIDLLTGNVLGDPAANGFSMNQNGQWLDTQGKVLETIQPSAPNTSPLTPGVDLNKTPSWLNIDGTTGIISSIQGASKNLLSSNGSNVSGSATGNGNTGSSTSGTNGTGGSGSGSGGGSGGSGQPTIEPGTTPVPPTETTTNPETLTTTNPVVIPSTLPTIPINLPIVTVGGTNTGGTKTNGTTSNLTAQQLAILATPTIFTPNAPVVDIAAPQVDLAGLVDQPAPIVQNTTNGYMPYLLDMPDLPYDYGSPQDVQAVTYASPNEGETTTMAATGGSVDDLLKLMDWRV